MRPRQKRAPECPADREMFMAKENAGKMHSRQRCSYAVQQEVEKRGEHSEQNDMEDNGAKRRGAKQQHPWQQQRWYSGG